jgi:hypothetical protein
MTNENSTLFSSSRLILQEVELILNDLRPKIGTLLLLAKFINDSFKLDIFCIYNIYICLLILDI